MNSTLGGEGRGLKLEPFPWNRNRDIPNGLWAYRGTAVMVEGGDQHSLDVPLKIKHAVLREENAFERMQREIEAFENIERSDIARRERIPDGVRLFVWQETGASASDVAAIKNLNLTTSSQLLRVAATLNAISNFSVNRAIVPKGQPLAVRRQGSQSAAIQVFVPAQ